jgi:protein-tyrosine sulfotransferase
MLTHMNAREKTYYIKSKYLSSSHDKILSLLVKPINTNTRPPLFISGSGRNGSTLISSILNNHDEIFIPPENTIIPFAINYWHLHPFKNWESKIEVIFKELKKPSIWKVDLTRLKATLTTCASKNRNINHLIESIYLEYARIHKKNKSIIWGDKTPSNTAYLYTMMKQFSHSKVIFLVRDPRAVICSLLVANHTYYSQRIDYMIWRWRNYLNKYYEIRKKNPNNIFFLRYEEFVASPAKITLQLVNWLGLQYDETLIVGKEKNMNLLGVGDAMHHQNIKNEISTDYINKWEIMLTAKDRANIENTLKNEMIALSYM